MKRETPKVSQVHRRMRWSRGPGLTCALVLCVLRAEVALGVPIDSTLASNGLRGAWSFALAQPAGGGGSSGPTVQRVLPVPEKLRERLEDPDKSLPAEGVGMREEGAEGPQPAQDGARAKPEVRRAVNDGTPARRILIDRRLQAEAIELVSLNIRQAGALPASGEITYIAARGERITRPIAEVLALAPWGWGVQGGGSTSNAPSALGELAVETLAADGLAGDLQPIAARQRYLELIDGQRLPGGPASLPLSSAAGSKQNAGDSVAWTGRLGTRSIPLEEVRRMVDPAGLLSDALRTGREVHADRLAGHKREGVPGAAGLDHFLLGNGDELSASLESIGRAGVVISDQGGGAGAPVGGAGGVGGARPTEIPLDQVRVIEMAEAPLVKVHAPSVLAWLEDGTVVRLGSLASDADGLTASGQDAGEKPAGGASGARMTLADVRGLVFDTSSVVALASVRSSSPRKVAPRQFDPRLRLNAELTTQPVALGALGIMLDGPVEVDWSLPTGARMVSGRLEMLDDATEWGDCVVVVATVENVQEQELYRVRINALRPRAEVRVELPKVASGAGAGTGVGAEEPRRLRVRVEPGDRGLVSNRVWLRHGLVLTGDAKAASAREALQ